MLLLIPKGRDGASRGLTVAVMAVQLIVTAWLYLRFGGMSWMQGAFYGIGAAVIAIVNLVLLELFSFAA